MEITDQFAIRPFEHGPTYAEINLSALEHNFKAIRRWVGKCKVMAVVKSEAYGHGMLRCARLFSDLNADYLGVAHVEEGVLLREAGLTKPIIVFGGVIPNQIGSYIDFGLELTVSSLDNLQAVNASARAKGKRAKIHIKIDTGMHRMGANPNDVPQMIQQLKKCENIELGGVYTHFACADDTNHSQTQEQLRIFLDLSREFQRDGSVLLHTANSAAVMQHRDSHLDMVRPGLSLYGMAPAVHLRGVLDLKPALSLKTQVVFVRKVRKGEGVSYGHTWRANEDATVVTLPIGYADGYHRILSNRAQLIVNGRRCDVAGRVCMDQFMLHVPNDVPVKVGDEVVVIGQQGGATVTADELADLAGTMSYEILTSVSWRVPRRYVAT